MVKPAQLTDVDSEQLAHLLSQPGLRFATQNMVIPGLGASADSKYTVVTFLVPNMPTEELKPTQPAGGQKVANRKSKIAQPKQPFLSMPQTTTQLKIEEVGTTLLNEQPKLNVFTPWQHLPSPNSASTIRGQPLSQIYGTSATANETVPPPEDTIYGSKSNIASDD